MATPTTTTSSSAPASTGCGATLYVIPAPGAACAMPFRNNNTAILSACCGRADVVSYSNNCGLYCLAQGQNVGTLTSCMFHEGAPYADVFCNAMLDGTSNPAAGDKPLSAGASVVAVPSSTSRFGIIGPVETGLGSGESGVAVSVRVGGGVKGLVGAALLVWGLFWL